MPAKYKYMCGVPQEHCEGGNLKTDQTFSTRKAHSGRHEAFRCMAHYLVKQLGYTQIGSREFRKEGHPIRVLTKKSRYGGVLRFGKEHARWMPKGDGGGYGGLIVG